MSGYSGLNGVSKTLANLIWNSIQGDTQITDIISSESQISLLPPKDAADKAAKVSIFLYNITEYSNMRNQPHREQNPPQPPTLLYLTLHYLVTPLTADPDNDQTILGKIMQLLSETPVLRGSNLQGSLSGSSEDLKIALDSFSIDDINKLWSVLGGQYKLSISYRVSPITIEATHTLDQKRVVEETINYKLR